MINIPLINKLNFYSKKLTGDILRLYNASVDNLARGVLKTTVRFSSPIDEEFDAGFRDIIEAIFYGCPELFYVEQQVEYAYRGNEVTLTFTNKYARENVNELWIRLDAELNRMAAKIKMLPAAYDRIQRINEYLCIRVKPNQSMVGRFGDAYGALILREARCEGYAKAAQLLLQRVGFPASIIICGRALVGDGQEEHAWNLIPYRSQYYHFDFTWNASRMHHDIPGQEYMFLDDEQALIEHFPAHSDYPKCADATKTFWAMHKGITYYHSDLSRIEIVPFKNNYMAIAKPRKMPTPQELERDIFDWMQDELSAYNYGARVSYAVNERMGLLIFYFINQ